MKYHSILLPLFWILLCGNPLLVVAQQSEQPETQTETTTITATEQNSNDDLNAIFEQGLVLYRQGEHEQAFVEFEKLISAYNNRNDLSSMELTVAASAARYLGVSDPQLYKDAVRVYQEAIDKDATNLSAYTALGDLLLEKYNNTEAIEVFRDALKIEPEHPELLLGLARSQHFDHSPEAMETTGNQPDRAGVRALRLSSCSSIQLGLLYLSIYLLICSSSP